MFDVKKYGRRWFVATDQGVFEIVATGNEDPWFQKIEIGTTKHGVVDAVTHEFLYTWKNDRGS